MVRTFLETDMVGEESAKGIAGTAFSGESISARH